MKSAGLDGILDYKHTHLHLHLVRVTLQCTLLRSGEAITMEYSVTSWEHRMKKVVQLQDGYQ